MWKDCSDPQVTFGLSFSPKISRQARHLRVLMDMTAILFIEIILSNLCCTCQPAAALDIRA